MAKVEEKNLMDSTNFDLDESEIEMKEVVKETPKERKREKINREVVKDDTQLINCLRNERVIVRYIPKQINKYPKGHVFEGGMSENAIRSYVVPKLSHGGFVNVLTDNEKAYLEEIMSLEYNALSVYRKEDNFWDDGNEVGISRVTLHKQDNYLDLSNPEDYIRYKILLANKDFIAPSIHDLEDKPKSTYEFVIISEGEETKTAKDGMTLTMKCYKEFGKIENDSDKLRFIVKVLDGRPMSKDTKLEFLQVRINALIQSDSKLFLRVVTDELLDTKVMIEKAVEEGLISKRGDQYYLRSDNTPLCGHNEEPTLNVAAKYLTLPKNQDLLFSLQEKLK